MYSYYPVLAIVFIFHLCWPAPSVAEEGMRKLRVGIIAPLTGGIATWGVSVQSAIELANADSDTPVELFFEDEETCSPVKAISGFNFLQSVKKVDIVVASCLGGAQAIAPVAIKAKLPLFISGRSSRDFHDKNPNALSWLSLLDYEGEAIARLIKAKGWKKGVALVWSEYFGVQFAGGIENGVKKERLDFNFSAVEIDPSAIPSVTEIQKMLRGSPDVLFLMMSEPAAAFVVRQLRAFNYTGAILLQSSLLQTYDSAVRTVFKGALQQKFTINADLTKRLQSRIQTKQGDAVADDFVFSYDGFSALLKEASACRADPELRLEECLKRRLRNEEWRDGASGRFRFMKDGSTERPMVFKTITEMGFQ